MCDSLMGIAEGVSAQAAANTAAQLTTSLAVIDLVDVYLANQSAYSQLLDTDAENIFIANMNIPGNPSGPATAAAVTEQRTIDSTESDLSTGTLDNLIQGQKGQAQIQGTAMEGIFDLQTPCNELLKTEVNALQQLLI